MEAAKFGHDFGRATKVMVPSLDDWEKEWGGIHNVACNQSCCRWVSGRRRLSSRNQINISYVPLADPFPFVWTGAVQFFSISQRLFYLMFDTQFLPRRNRAIASSAKTGFDAT